MNDITIILPTLNLLPEGWCEFHKQKLLEAADGATIITISKKPMWGVNIVQDDEQNVNNLYHKFLTGAKLATTPYIGIAEDDTLYPPNHFKHRPVGRLAYNMNRWGILSWGTPVYFYKPREANATLIAPRQLWIDQIEKAFEESPVLEWEQYRKIGTKQFNPYIYSEFYTDEPVICFSHPWGVDPLEKRKRKAKWPVQAYDLPRWGRAEDLVKHFA